MATTFHLRVWTRFFAPVEDVWALKTDPAAIQAEFRPYSAFSIQDGDALRRALGGALPADLSAALRLGHLLPVAWPIHLASAVKNTSFRDTSTNALFTRFEHDHLFEPTPDGCRYVDAVTFTSKAPAQKLFAIGMQRLFQHRHAVAATRLKTDPQATGVAVLRVLVEAEDAA
jgi:ligand-binding SRPBCC domain-containing protein